MATARPKEKSTVGKEKVLSTNSQSTSTNTTRPSTPSDKPISSSNTTRPSTPSDKPTSSSSSEKEKHIPNYLKPTISSRIESHSFKNTKTDSPQRTATNRRRSLDKPSSSSNLTKHTQSSSRLHKALVSPGPRERSGLQHQSLSLSSKSASEKTSRTSRDGTLSTNTKSVKSPSPTAKKVARDGSTNANSTRAPKSDAVTKEVLKNVETEAEVKDASNEKVKMVMEDDNKQESENETDQINPPIVDSENEHENKKEREQGQEVEESKAGEPQIQADNNDITNVIPTASEEEEAGAVSVAEEIKQVVEVEETKKEDPPEEKAEAVHQKGENKSPDSIDHPEPEEQTVDVEEKEEGNHNRVTNKMEGENNELEKAKGKEVMEGETVGVKLKEGEDDDNKEEKREIKEEKAESTSKQQGAREQGKKETSQVSNDVIEETASKLEKRTNKVRALAGAFQTVIDHQSK